MRVLSWLTLLLGAALSIFALTTVTDPTYRWPLFAAGALVAVSSAWALGYAGRRRGEK